MKVNNLKIKNSFDGNLIFGSKNFNKKTNRDKHLKENKKNYDFKKLFNSQGLISRKYTIERKCPVCNGRVKYSRIEFVKQGFVHRICNKCQMFYVSPILKKKLSHKIHYEQKSFNKVYENSLQIKMDKKKFLYGLKIIEKFSKKKNKILDIGCGTGGFIDLAQNRKWNVEGIEFNKYSSNLLKKKGFIIYEDYLENLKLEKKYSCISMWNLFEHLPNPKMMLQEIYKILAPNGLIFMLIPNINGLVNSILREKAVAFAGYTHLNFFSKNTLKNFLEKNKFQVVHYETIFTEIETINNYLSYKDPYLGVTKKKPNYFSPKFIHENYLGSKLIMVAKKK